MTSLDGIIDSPAMDDDESSIPSLRALSRPLIVRTAVSKGAGSETCSPVPGLGFLPASRCACAPCCYDQLLSILATSCVSIGSKGVAQTYGILISRSV